MAAPSGFPGYQGSVLSFPDEIDTYKELRPVRETTPAGAHAASWIYLTLACATAVGTGALMFGRRSRKLATEAQY